MPPLIQASPFYEIIIDENGNKVGIILDGAIYRLQTDAKLSTGDNVVGRVKITDGSNTVNLVYDSGIYKVPITGTVNVTPPPPPETATIKIIAADNPLTMTTHTTEYIIPNGKTFHLQRIIAGGTVGNQDEGGKVTLHYNNGTQRLVSRVYLRGVTQFLDFSNINKTRDDTTMVGNGSTFKLQIIREGIGGKFIELDVLILGYEL